LFDTVLRNARSPALNQGFTSLDLYKAVQGKGLNPAVALAFFSKESQFGTNGISVYNIYNWGNIRPSSSGNIGRAVGIYDTGNSGPLGYGKFRKYANYRDSLLDWCDLMNGPTYSGKGLYEVLAIYAPASDRNDPNGYAGSVLRLVNNWNQQSGNFYADLDDSSVEDPVVSANQKLPLPAHFSVVAILAVAVVLLAVAVVALAVVYRRASRRVVDEPLLETVQVI